MIFYPAIRRAALVLLAVGFAGAALSACGMASDGLPDYRYRLTVELETPEGLKTGSSVIEVTTSIAGRKSIPTPGVIGRRARGEAVTVDLGARGLLFALLSSDSNYDWANGVMFGFAPDDLPQPLDENGEFDPSAYFKARFMAMLKNRDLIVLFENSGAQYTGAQYTGEAPTLPILVHFDDLADPTTVERVDPYDLAVAFGAGVRLRRITLQLTDDPVTTGIATRLPWLPRQQGSLIPIPKGASIGELPIGARLNEGNFFRRTIK